MRPPIRLAALFALASASACAPAASEGWLSLGYGKINETRGPIQLLAYFVRPQLGSDGMNLDALGCASEEDQRRATLRRLTKASSGAIVSAGTLTIGPRGGPARVVPVPATGLTYGTIWEPFYGADQPIDIRFEGGDAPSFAGTVVAPPAIALVEPACASSQPTCAPFDRSRDLVVRWTAASHGYVTVELRRPGSALLTNHCTFDARAGSGVVPRAIVPPRGDVELAFRPFAAASFAGERGSMLHVSVEAPVREWLIADR